MSNQDQNTPLSRREALKAIAVATGAVTLTSLPQKWETPLVEVGLLPAHAQSSACSIKTDQIEFGSSCDEVDNGILLLFIGTLADANVASASGIVDASSSQWEFISFDVNDSNPRQFAVLFCIVFDLSQSTQVTINATDVNGLSCSTTFEFGDSTNTIGVDKFDWK